MFVEAKQSALPATLELYFYTDIQSDYFDWMSWSRVTSETSADYVRKALNKAGNIENIRLYVNSFGGSVKEALGIYSQLRRHPATVTGFCDGFACSAAAVILSACDKVVMGCNTVQMIHYPLNSAFGNADDLRRAAEDLDVLGLASEEAFVARCEGKASKEKIQELMRSERFLTAKDCLELGLCDEIGNEEVDMDERYKSAMPQQRCKQTDMMSELYFKQFGGTPPEIYPQEPASGTPNAQVPTPKQTPQEPAPNNAEPKETLIASAFLKAYEKI